MPTVVTTGAGEVKGTYECGGRGRHQLKIWCWRWVIDREHSKLKGWANEGGRGVVKAVKWLPLPVTHCKRLCKQCRRKGSYTLIVWKGQS